LLVLLPIFDVYSWSIGGYLASIQPYQMLQLIWRLRLLRSQIQLQHNDNDSFWKMRLAEYEAFYFLLTSYDDLNRLTNFMADNFTYIQEDIVFILSSSLNQPSYETNGSSSHGHHIPIPLAIQTISCKILQSLINFTTEYYMKDSSVPIQAISSPFDDIQASLGFHSFNKTRCVMTKSSDVSILIAMLRKELKYMITIAETYHNNPSKYADSNGHIKGELSAMDEHLKWTEYVCVISLNMLGKVIIPLVFIYIIGQLCYSYDKFPLIVRFDLLIIYFV
jgi:hypothetical protein